MKSSKEARHFEGTKGKELIQTLKQQVHKKVGKFEVEPFEGSIKFVSNFSFLTVKVMSDTIRIDFFLDRVKESFMLFKLLPENISIVLIFKTKKR